MAAEFFRKDELENEITRPEILKNQPYYRNKGKRFTENMAGYAMMAKPGPPEAWMETLPDVHRLDKAQMVMLVEENLIPRDAGIECLRAFKEMEKDGLEGMLKARAEAGAGLYSGENYLISKLGEAVGGWVHLGRSSGDEVTGTLRMKIRKEILETLEKALDLPGNAAEGGRAARRDPLPVLYRLPGCPDHVPWPITFWTSHTRRRTPARN